jgi:hypothetical protein
VKHYAQAILVLSCLFVALGLAIIIRTAQVGGGVGYLIGVLFLGLGIGRIYLQRRR